jgi:DNA-binding response OmpR family regulator
MKKKRILIVEDEPAVRENLRRCLELEGYDVDALSNGGEALTYLRKQKPDLVICDLMMPEVDGFGVLTQLRTSPATKTIPFIFLTASTDVKNVISATRLRVSDYVTKPFKLAELLAIAAKRLQDSGKS